jgi:Rab guanine nucleotide exchange factor SEC2
LSEALVANAHGSGEAQEIQPELQTSTATSAVQEVGSVGRAEEGNDEAANQPLPLGVSGKEVEAGSVVDAPAPSIMSVSVYSPTSHTTVLESEPSMLNGVVSSMGKVEEYKPAAKDGERDGETYVGDATWEERTWKELVKIKEEMFLARIGALR